MIDFTSRNIKNKLPFGSVKTRQKVFINIGIKEGIYALDVKFILRKDNSFDEYTMNYDKKIGDYHYFTLDFNVKSAGVYFYRFQINTPDGYLHVGHNGDCNGVLGEWLKEWQLTVSNENFKTPDWIKGGLIYHIFVDRFCRAEDNKKIKPLKKWNDEVTVIDSDGVYRANDFYGGNFLGIIEKLPYLKKLGVTLIYLSPIFKSYSNHRYDTGDYSIIDEIIGDEETFKLLIEKAKKAGIRILLDGVFNHTGSDSKYFNKFNEYPDLGAFQSHESPYYDWYTFNEDGTYDCWWGCTNVPNIKKNSISFQNYILNEVLTKWLDFGIAGYRLDVVDELSLSFLEKVYEKSKKVSQDNLIIGEVWEDASTKIAYEEDKLYFTGNKLDGVMNYPFKNAIIELIKEKNIDKFINDIMIIEENYPQEALNVSMTLLGSHDTVRIINELADITVPETKQERLNYRIPKEIKEETVKKLKIASLIQYFLSGVPTVYYGDEIGMEGFEDPINRRPFDDENINKDLLEHYIFLGNLRKKHKKDFISRIELFNSDGLSIKKGSLTAKIDLNTLTFKIIN